MNEDEELELLMLEHAKRQRTAVKPPPGQRTPNRDARQKSAQNAVRMQSEIDDDEKRKDWTWDNFKDGAVDGAVQMADTVSWGAAPRLAGAIFGDEQEKKVRESVEDANEESPNASYLGATLGHATGLIKAGGTALAGQGAKALMKEGAKGGALAMGATEYGDGGDADDVALHGLGGAAVGMATGLIPSAAAKAAPYVERAGAALGRPIKAAAKGVGNMAGRTGDALIRGAKTISDVADKHPIARVPVGIVTKGVSEAVIGASKLFTNRAATKAAQAVAETKAAEKAARVAARAAKAARTGEATSSPPPELEPDELRAMLEKLRGKPNPPASAASPPASVGAADDTVKRAPPEPGDIVDPPRAGEGPDAKRSRIEAIAARLEAAPKKAAGGMDDVARQLDEEAATPPLMRGTRRSRERAEEDTSIMRPEPKVSSAPSPDEAPDARSDRLSEIADRLKADFKPKGQEKTNAPPNRRKPNDKPTAKYGEAENKVIDVEEDIDWLRRNSWPPESKAGVWNRNDYRADLVAGKATSRPTPQKMAPPNPPPISFASGGNPPPADMAASINSLRTSQERRAAIQMVEGMDPEYAAAVKDLLGTNR